MLITVKCIIISHYFTCWPFERGYISFYSSERAKSELNQNTREHSPQNSTDSWGTWPFHITTALWFCTPFTIKRLKDMVDYYLTNLKVLLIRGIFFYLYNVIGVLAFGPLLWLVSDLFCCNVFLSPDQSRRRNCRSSCCSRAAERGGGPEAAAAHGCRTLQGEIQGMSATAKTSA